jgi:hypothetical protein
MANSILNKGEIALIQSSVSKFSLNNVGVNLRGILIGTGNRVLFLSHEGKINHEYSLDNISGFRIEKRFLGEVLVVDTIFGENQRTFRYEGVNEIQDWVFHLEEQLEVRELASTMLKQQLEENSDVSATETNLVPEPASETVFCGQCGEKNKATSKFCRKCGKPID